MVHNIILSSMIRVQNFIAAMKEERGQDLMEYAVLAGAIAIVAAAALWFTIDFDPFADAVQACITFDSVGCDLP